jgi:hypothetical protein
MWASFETELQQLYAEASDFLPVLLAGIAVLILGWILAWLISILFRKALERTSIDNRIAAWVTGGEEGKEIPVEKWFAKAIFWFLMLIVLVAFFQVLGLNAVTEPLNSFLVGVFSFLPRLLGPALLALIAWVLGSSLRFFVRRVLESSELDRRFLQTTKKEEVDETEQKAVPVPLSKTLSETVYWLVWLLFLPAILGPLGLSGILQPIQNLVDELLGFLPQLLAAGLIFGVGWLVARIIQRVVTSLLAAVGVDRLADQVGVANALGKQRLSAVLGTVLYVLILIPVLIAALDALQIESITRPASEMLNTILLALPNMFAAALILAIAYLIGRVVAGLVSTILESVGFNRVLEKVGLTKEATEGQKTPSDLIGTLVLVAVLLLAVLEASELLGFGLVAELVAQFIVFAGQIVLGLIVLGIGLYLANLASAAIRSSRAREAGLLAAAAKIAIVVLAAAMALRQMGLANEIIQLAFGLTLGAVAVALALAFGLGAREAASQQVAEWRKSLKSKPKAD